MAAIKTLPTLNKEEFIQQFQTFSRMPNGCPTTYNVEYIVNSKRQELQQEILPIFSNFLSKTQRRNTKRGNCYALIVFGLTCIRDGMGEGTYNKNTNPTPIAVPPKSEVVTILETILNDAISNGITIAEATSNAGKGKGYFNKTLKRLEKAGKEDLSAVVGLKEQYNAAQAA